MQRRDPDGAETSAIDALIELKGRHVIDVGCGSSRLTSLAAARAGAVDAFDPDADSVAQAKASLSQEARKKVRFEVHAAEALDVPRRRFDVALCGWSL
jgi:ubiquinone/menaquinone biosynthesis C-methylase UbiE